LPIKKAAKIPACLIRSHLLLPQIFQRLYFISEKGRRTISLLLKKIIVNYLKEEIEWQKDEREKRGGKLAIA
jgi:hypothetical protein